MESSPLRFLDLDVSLMLADEVRNSQEKEARAFHDNLFENSHEINLNLVPRFNLNWEHHYLMARVFEDIGYLLTPLQPYKPNEQHMYATEKVGFSRCYEVCAKSYIENTRLQRCGYNH
jgi:hypothetical protein